LSQHYSKVGERYEQRIKLDDSTKQMNVNVFGSNTTLLVVDPHSRSFNGEMREKSKSSLSFQNPVAGVWLIKSQGKSRFTTEIEITWEILMHYGFSVKKPRSLADTSKSPIKGMLFYLINFMYF
jgi:hypothetical protein